MRDDRTRQSVSLTLAGPDCTGQACSEDLEGFDTEGVEKMARIQAACRVAYRVASQAACTAAGDSMIHNWGRIQAACTGAVFSSLEIVQLYRL